MPQPDPNGIRHSLARQVSDQFSRLPGFRASLLTGSTALGLADDSSDVDVVLFFDALPDAATFESRRQALGSDRLLFAFGEPGEGDFVQSFLLSGIKTDVACVSLARWRADAEEVTVRYNVESPFHKALDGLLSSIALEGAAIVEELRREAAYPAGLVEAVVSKNMRFYPPWALREQAADRGDAVYFYELLAGEVGRLIRVLCGLNRIYHGGETKRSDYLLSRMKVTPRGIREDLPTLFGASMPEAAGRMDQLIRSTFDLVEVEAPMVDVGAARRRYATPLAS